MKYSRTGNTTMYAGAFNTHYLSTALQHFFPKIVKKIINPDAVDEYGRWAWLLASTTSGPIYCSEGPEFSKHFECQRMIGAAVK